MIKVSISLTDPWDLGEAIAWQRLHGELVEAIDDERAGQGLIKLDKRLEYEGMSHRYFVVSPRHKDDKLSALETGKSVFCGLIAVSDEQADSASALDTSQWRGGLALIATAEPRF